MGPLFYWLNISLSVFLAFAPPEVHIDNRGIVVSLETAHVLTSEMAGLVSGGLSLEFELYCSLRVTGTDGASTLVIRKIHRSIGYDYLRESFFVVEDGRELGAFKDPVSAQELLRRYSDLSFSLQSGWKEVSLFVELRSVGNPLLEERFGKDGMSLWNGYSPAAKAELSNTGGQQ